MVFCTEVLEWVVVLRAAAWVVFTARMVASFKTTTHSKNSVQKTIRCNLISNASDEGHMYVPETCRVKNTSINYLVASSWHFTLYNKDRLVKVGVNSVYLLYLKFVRNNYP